MMGATEEVMDGERFRDFFEGWEDPWNFAHAETTSARLEAAGFGEVETWLQDEVTRFGSRDELHASEDGSPGPASGEAAGVRSPALRRRGG